MSDYKTKMEIKQLLENIGFKEADIKENTKKGWLCIIGVK